MLTGLATRRQAVPQRASNCPSGLNATPGTSSPWPVRVAVAAGCTGMVTSHKITVAPFPQASTRPSGLSPTVTTRMLWPVKVAVRFDEGAGRGRLRPQESHNASLPRS